MLRRWVWVWGLALLAYCGGSSGDDLDGGMDGRGNDSTTSSDSSTDASSDTGTKNDATNDTGTNDTGTNDGSDAGTSDAESDAADSSATDGCTPPTGPITGCGGTIASCDYATSYCLGGAVPNSCDPIPSECQCEQTHTCACLLAHVTVCDGGTESCTTYADGGELWILWSGCK